MNTTKLTWLREQLNAAQKEYDDAKEVRSQADKRRRLAEKAIADLTAAIVKEQGEELARAAQAAAQAEAKPDQAVDKPRKGK